MLMPFESSGTAERWFLRSLEERDYTIKEIRDVKIQSGRGRVITQKLAITTTGDAFEIAFWSQLYQLIPTEQLREDFAKVRDVKLKSVLRVFGCGNIDVLGLQMSAVLDLLELERDGIFVHLVFLIKDGRVFWCRVRSFYDFVMRYDSFLIHAPTYGGEFCLVPIEWLLKWDNPVIAPGSLAKESL